MQERSVGDAEAQRELKVLMFGAGAILQIEGTTEAVIIVVRVAFRLAILLRRHVDKDMCIMIEPIARLGLGGDESGRLVLRRRREIAQPMVILRLDERERACDK